MDTSIKKEERIEIRVSPFEKRMIQKAQLLSGDKSISSFIMRILNLHTEKIIKEKDKLLVSERDRNIFFDAVFCQLEPNEELKQAYVKYKAITPKNKK